LRGDLSDKLRRKMRKEHNIVNEGLKDIRKNIGAHYNNGRNRIKRDIKNNYSPTRE